MTNLSSLSFARVSVIFGLIFSVIGLAGIFLDYHIIEIAAFLIAFAAAGTALYFTGKVGTALQQTIKACEELRLGKFETRILNITEKGDLGEMMWALNDTADNIDAFVRESTAAMDYVSHNQYFRRILENGMRGSLLHGSRTINAATESVAKKMASFADVAGSLEKSLGEVTGEIQQTVGMLENAAQQMEKAVTHTNTRADSVVSTSDENSSSVQTISAAAEEMSAAIREISTQMSQTMEMSNSAVAESVQAEERIQQLVIAADKIDSVVALIQDIADQTNLLALNATIEAARAGDAGKGFAVVANEVKTLADQTAKATGDITGLIRTVQKITGEAADSFAHVREKISRIGESATGVAAAVEEQTAAAQEVARGAEMASSGTIQVVDSIRDIKQNISSIDESSGQIMVVTDTLSTQSAQKISGLVQEMGEFMTELRKIV